MKRKTGRVYKTWTERKFETLLKHLDQAGFDALNLHLTCHCDNDELRVYSANMARVNKLADDLRIHCDNLRNRFAEAVAQLAMGNFENETAE